MRATTGDPENVESTEGICHSNEIEAFRADVSEAKAKLERLHEKLAEIDSQREEATSAIDKAKHIAHIQKESTSVEVFRLKGTPFPPTRTPLTDIHVSQASLRHLKISTSGISLQSRPHLSSSSTHPNTA